ncbi:adhesion G-protein coupled receptor D1-like [Planococcus citri]|uniref:adhesion G-protein coupled receptor D1-like n=1 Tax=Planococcus citri TaxID=170843 RepID=UPI0031F7DF1D
MTTMTTHPYASFDHNDQNYLDYLPSVISANVISIIGFGISILLLCTHLIVYSITEDMWTLTGNSLASFCCSLLLSYCAYIGGMVVHDTSTPCAIVALLAFYFFLSNSSWLLSISLQLYNSSSSRARKSQQSSSTTWAFVRYSLFSWAEPALILGAALYIESYNFNAAGSAFKMPKNLRVDIFPPETNCFNRNVSVLIWFLVLFNVNLIATFIISAVTAFAVYRNGNRRRLDADTDPGNDNDEDFFTVLKYYMRLSLLVGFVWIVGMCMIHFKGHILQIIFAISNAALALYIFLVFTFNNKLSSIAFNDDRKSYDMETFHRHSHEHHRSPARSSDV